MSSVPNLFPIKSRQTIPLKFIEIQTTTHDLLATSCITSTFANPIDSNTIEWEYVFPLPA